VSRARSTVRLVADAIPPETPGAGSLREKLVGCDEELAEALVGTERALDIVRGVETPIGPNKRQNVSTSEVLRLTLKLIRNELRAAASVEIDVHPVPLVSGSSAQLGQVMMNLLVEALDAMGGIPRDQCALSIRLSHQEPWVVFEVMSAVASPDSGDSLAAPSSRKPASAQAKVIGHAISLSIVEALGGQLHVESTPSGGVLRRLKLPQSYSSQRSERPSRPAV
jgi:two-component system NtrC family sensor kinase